MVRTAFVSGSGRNIGAAVAHALARQGMNVVVNVRTSVDEGERVCDELADYGVDVHLVVGSVADPKEVERMADEVLDKFGHVDVLVNNVGIAPMNRFADTTDEIWHMVLETSLSSAFYCTRAFVPGMQNEGWGRIVNVGGHAGLRGTRFKAANAAAKGGLMGLTRAVANEFAEFGITCNHVGPGQMEESHARKYYEDAAATLDPTYGADLLSRTPMGRRGRASEVAAACEFLVSERASYITGQSLLVNGGMYFG